MQENSIGVQIKELRKHFGISQRELCRDICSQSFISRIESGDLSPSADLLYRLSMRLGVDMNYFLERVYVPRMDYVQEVLLQLSESLKKKNYEQLKELVNHERRNPLFIQGKNRQQLLWYEAIYFYKIHGDFHRAIMLLDEALSMGHTTLKSHSEKEIEIYLTKANIHTERKELNEAISMYKDILTYLHRLPVIRDKELLIKVYYNYSRALYLNGELGKSLLFAQNGIRECRENRILFGMGELYFQMGRVYRDQSENELSKGFFEKAAMVSQLMEDENLKRMSESQMEHIGEAELCLRDLPFRHHNKEGI
ncbi:helix-turn-helix domain-containing protein [Rossellomorea vietnamensis]|uniref:helix-turn-helix domain-containing protein n=1 Tax=Rossellomorea vietnamensis TaxID=218284 RepID=UPI0009E74903|nr:helix-turn-helix domain-containing protein [Rossellomorea vietnamensis]